MKIEFLKFENRDNWVNGCVNDGEFYFESKLFDEGSIFGIDDGRVSKLNISIGNSFSWNNCIVNYDRGWDVEPTKEYIEVYEAVLEFLENAPTTRFD